MADKPYQHDPRDRFDISPQQYHAGLDKLWTALGITTVQDKDVFTLAATEIAALRTALARLLTVVAKGCLGYFEYMKKQSSEFTPDEAWLALLVEAVAAAEPKSNEAKE